MNIKEVDKWLDKEYGVSYTRLEELHDFVIEQDLKHQATKDKELQRKDNIINGIKKEIKEQLEEYEKGKEKYKNYGSLEDYTLGLRSAYISMLNKINELEGDNK